MVRHVSEHLPVQEASSLPPYKARRSSKTDRLTLSDLGKNLAWRTWFARRYLEISEF